MRKLRRPRSARSWESFRVFLATGFDYFDDLRGHVPTEDESAEAWAELGESIMAEFAITHPGARPAGWWQFDAPAELRGERPYCGDQTAILNDHGLLTDAERETLRRQQMKRKSILHTQKGL
jgi:hypothetical protein